MKKTLIAALVLSAGVASQAFAQGYVKQGTFNIALTDTYQNLITRSGTVGSGSASWKFTSKAGKVTQQTILGSLAKVMKDPANKGVWPFFVGNFSTKATLVIENHEQSTPLTVGFIPIPISPVTPPAPWGWAPVNYWLATSEVTTGVNAKIFAKDFVAGVQVCYDVTPFFIISEDWCHFCWETENRVTDGTLKEIPWDPCFVGSGYGGSGKTRFYITFAFDNCDTSNPALDAYYDDGAGGFLAVLGLIDPNLMISPTPADVAGFLRFRVTGIMTYSWAFKTIKDVYAPFGSMTGTFNGFGQASIPYPFCGVFTGPITITETAAISCQY